MTRRYRVVVFDMDGVLVDTEPAFYDGVNIILQQEGRHIEWERYRVLLGSSVEETWREIISMLNMRGDADDYVRRYAEALIDCLSQQREPLAGAEHLLDALDERGVPFGLATSSWGRWKDIILSSAGLQDRFRVVVTGDTVKHEKPAPDLYLKAAELLGVRGKECIAVEDTVPGIAAAQAAGMFAVQVRAASSAGPPIEEADLVIDSLERFPLEMFDI